MYSIIKNPALCDPFTEPRNTTEQFKVFSERLTIVFVGSHTLARMWKLRSAARLYQLVRWCVGSWSSRCIFRCSYQRLQRFAATCPAAVCAASASGGGRPDRPKLRRLASGNAHSLLPRCCRLVREEVPHGGSAALFGRARLSRPQTQPRPRRAVSPPFLPPPRRCLRRRPLRRPRPWFLGDHPPSPLASCRGGFPPAPSLPPRAPLPPSWRHAP